MLLRGRPRTLGAAALLLLLLIGFFLFGGDPDCELGGKREARRGGGGGGWAVLCLAGPGSPRGVASGCWEFGWEAPSLHVTVQSHPDGPPKAQPGLSFRAPGEGGHKPADSHPTPPPKL